VVEVALDGVRKSFGGTVALDGVDLSVRDGEFFTLVGPSGCGKTTTLRIVAGLATPTGGTVRFGGEAMRGVPTEERDVGIVFQNYALFPHMTVGENVGYGLRFRDPPGGESDEERVADLLDLVDLDGLADRDPDRLSGGPQQRVALARALAPGPQLLLLDEPMSALDARLRTDLRRQVRRIQSNLGVTTVYVTHDQAEALAISDRVAVMHDGRVEQVDTPRGIYRRPATRFVAEFVGENNVFDGEIVDVRSGGGPDAGAAGDDGDLDGSDDGAADTAPDGDGASVEVAVGDATFRLAGGGRVGESVAFCVRPEALSTGADENRLEVRVRTAEFLGEATRAYADWEGRDVVLRTSEDLARGESLTVGFDPADAARFEG
jgi:thiamine transport system ATP-binding protein